MSRRGTASVIVLLLRGQCDSAKVTYACWRI